MLPSCDLSPADECGDDDTPSGAAAVCTRLLGVRMGVRSFLTFSPSAAQPEGVEEEEEEVQAQTHQSHRTDEQNRLEREESNTKEEVKTIRLIAVLQNSH